MSIRIESRWGLPQKPKLESLNSGHTNCSIFRIPPDLKRMPAPLD